LREGAAELDFAGVGRLPICFTRSPLGLLFDHGNAGPIHPDIENRNRLAHDHRQMQLRGLVHGGLFALTDIGADGFSRSFNRFGGYGKSRQ
jgi:hypothetical protein